MEHDKRLIFMKMILDSTIEAWVAERQEGAGWADGEGKEAWREKAADHHPEHSPTSFPAEYRNSRSTREMV
jgi:hypothetical protein